jgi:hypothetical protein
LHSDVGDRFAAVIVGGTDSNAAAVVLGISKQIAKKHYVKLSSR